MRILYSIHQLHFAAEFIFKNNDKIQMTRGEIFENIMDDIRFYGKDKNTTSISTLGYTINFSNLYLDYIIIAEVTVDPSLGVEKQFDGEFNEMG